VQRVQVGLPQGQHPGQVVPRLGGGQRAAAGPGLAAAGALALRARGLSGLPAARPLQAVPVATATERAART
jgi:hypothetical protein